MAIGVWGSRRQEARILCWRKYLDISRARCRCTPSENRMICRLLSLALSNFESFRSAKFCVNYASAQLPTKVGRRCFSTSTLRALMTPGASRPRSCGSDRERENTRSKSAPTQWRPRAEPPERSAQTAACSIFAPTDTPLPGSRQHPVTPAK